MSGRRCGGLLGLVKSQTQALPVFRRTERAKGHLDPLLVESPSRTDAGIAGPATLASGGSHSSDDFP